MNKIEISEIFLAQGGKCFYCNLPMDIKKNNPASSTKDHFLPRCKGYKLNGNTVLSHGVCNWFKGHREVTEKERVKFKKLYKKIKARKEKLEMVKKKYAKNFKYKQD